MSTNTGISPLCIIGQIVVDHENAETITSSPGFKKFRFLSVKTDNDKRLADEPELQLTAYLNLYFLA